MQQNDHAIKYANLIRNRYCILLRLYYLKLVFRIKNILLQSKHTRLK